MQQISLQSFQMPLDTSTKVTLILTGPFHFGFHQACRGSPFSNWKPHCQVYKPQFWRFHSVFNVDWPGNNRKTGTIIYLGHTSWNHTSSNSFPASNLLLHRLWTKWCINWRFFRPIPQNNKTSAKDCNVPSITLKWSIFVHIVKQLYQYGVTIFVCKVPPKHTGKSVVVLKKKVTSNQMK